MFYLGTCSVCEQGNLGIRICSLAEDAVIICDECDALWLSTDLSQAPVFPEQPDLPCPQCNGNLIEPPAHWARFGEVYQRGWIAAIQGEFPEAL